MAATTAANSEFVVLVIVDPTRVLITTKTGEFSRLVADYNVWLSSGKKIASPEPHLALYSKYNQTVVELKLKVLNLEAWSLEDRNALKPVIANQ